jgi:hypothetical protein
LVFYRSGKTLAGLSYTRVDNANDLAHDAGTTFGVRHDFGAFRVAGIAQSGAWHGTRTSAAASPTSIFSRSYRSYLVGGSVPVATTTTVNVSWKRYDDRTAGNFDASQLSINAVHALPRQTDLYAGHSRLKNRRASSYSVSDASTAYTGVAPGASTSLLAAGIQHTFWCRMARPPRG